MNRICPQINLARPGLQACDLGAGHLRHDHLRGLPGPEKEYSSFMTLMVKVWACVQTMEIC